MKMSNIIDLEEQKSIQLEMLKEVHKFCVKHEIRYSISYGTLLGAVRHKGFIPWDDDVDIMMPVPDMFRFKRLFKSDNLYYCDVDVNKNYENAFSEIVHYKSYRKRGAFLRDRGVGIDLYPVISIPDSKKEQEQFFNECQLLFNKRMQALKWKYRFNHYLSIMSFPGLRSTLLKYRDYLINYAPEYGSTNSFYIISEPISRRAKDIYTFDLFSEMMNLDFEDSSFCAISKYDLFLKAQYGDYMQLPPEDQRHPYHGQTYYWK